MIEAHCPLAYSVIAVKRLARRDGREDRRVTRWAAILLEVARPNTPFKLTASRARSLLCRRVAALAAAGGRRHPPTSLAQVIRRFYTYRIVATNEQTCIITTALMEFFRIEEPAQPLHEPDLTGGMRDSSPRELYLGVDRAIILNSSNMW